MLTLKLTLTVLFLPYSEKYYDLLPKCGTAQAYLSHPTFNSGTALTPVCKNCKLGKILNT